MKPLILSLFHRVSSSPQQRKSARILLSRSKLEFKGVIRSGTLIHVVTNLFVGILRNE